MKLRCALILLAMTMLLSGCEHAPPKEPAPPQIIKICGKVRDFTPALQLQMAEALDQLPPDSPIHKIAQDWERMRIENRACAKTGNK